RRLEVVERRRHGGTVGRRNVHEIPERLGDHALPAQVSDAHLVHVPLGRGPGARLLRLAQDIAQPVEIYGEIHAPSLNTKRTSVQGTEVRLPRCHPFSARRGDSAGGAALTGIRAGSPCSPTSRRSAVISEPLGSERLRGARRPASTRRPTLSDRYKPRTLSVITISVAVIPGSPESRALVQDRHNPPALPPRELPVDEIRPDEPGDFKHPPEGLWCPRALHRAHPPPRHCDSAKPAGGPGATTRRLWRLEDSPQYNTGSIRPAIARGETRLWRGTAPRALPSSCRRRSPSAPG